MALRAIKKNKEVLQGFALHQNYIRFAPKLYLPCIQII
jgi:hypothetical protein